METRGTMRLAAVGDIHCDPASRESLQRLLAHISQQADVLLLCGDLTNYGLPEEARLLAAELAPLTRHLSIVGVLGNHDYESGRPEEIKRILGEAGVTILDGEGCEIGGIGFAGSKGFGGGFGERALQPWGEEAMKQFVREAVDEALKLESALARLQTPQRIALLHYAPIQATVEGEAPEIFPFLGSSRLEEPLNRYQVSAIFHGHAHHGSLEGRTSHNVPVYNVALPLLRQVFPDRPPFRVIELPLKPFPTPAPADVPPGAKPLWSNPVGFGSRRS